MHAHAHPYPPAALTPSRTQQKLRRDRRTEAGSRENYARACGCVRRHVQARKVVSRGWEFGLPRVPTPSYCTRILTLPEPRAHTVDWQPPKQRVGQREKERVRGGERWEEERERNERGHVSFRAEVSFGNTYRVSQRELGAGVLCGTRFESERLTVISFCALCFATAALGSRVLIVLGNRFGF